MNTEIKRFKFAYDDYEKTVAKLCIEGKKILEIGGGAFPSVLNHQELDYTIIDPDKEELEKSNTRQKIHSKLEEWKTEEKFDCIVSMMVLEHIPNPDVFHKKIFDLLERDGDVVHLYACRNSIPAIVNRFLPEFIGDFILKVIRNRDLENEPKYKAYYRRTKGPNKDDISFLESLGFLIGSFNGYTGHNYFHAIPLLRNIENLYSSVLSKMKLGSMSTVSVLHLKKNQG